MSKKSTEARAAKRVQIVERNQAKRRALKEAWLDQSAPKAARGAARLAFSKMPRDASATRLRARCLITGRGRGVFGWAGLSRHKLRELAMRGEVPGVRLASW